CIELEQPNAPALVRGDPNVIEIAVRNLAENAIRHSPPGSTIGLRIGADAHLEVVDAGPGIADELPDTIFESFWSGDPHGAGPDASHRGRLFQEAKFSEALGKSRTWIGARPARPPSPAHDKEEIPR